MGDRFQRRWRRGRPVVLLRPDVQVARSAVLMFVTLVAVLAPQQRAVAVPQIELVEHRVQAGVEGQCDRQDGIDVREVDVELLHTEDPHWPLVHCDPVTYESAETLCPDREMVERVAGGLYVRREDS